MKNTIRQRLAALRTEMIKIGIDAWYISGTDPHNSEYLPELWQTRKFISGFTGSYGVVVVMQNEALLWTDTRYFLQAEQQLEGTGIEMMKLRVPDAVSPEMWLVQKLSAGSKVGLDSKTVTVSGFRSFQKVLEKNGIELLETPDLLGIIWKDRPSIPDYKIFELGLRNAGFTRDEKQKLLVAELHKSGAELQIVTMLDELAWLFNLRGSDIAYNPVFMGFGVIGKKGKVLFVNSDKMEPFLQQKLEAEGVQLKEYKAFYSYLKNIKNEKIFVDPGSLNYSAFSILQAGNELVEGTSLVSLLKAQKNAAELEGFRQTMRKDGVALVEFLYWLKDTVGKEPVTDYDAGIKLKEFRSEQEDFKGESFPPIIGYKSRGAIVHLSVGKNDALPLEPDGILLFDSGGHYLSGTTDITRTVALGKVSDQIKRDFTLVLKGMIGLSRACFPYGVKGCHLDILARQALWNNGLNYGHGTGHGVGHFLNVHEGPMSIRLEYNENMILPGNVLSNEPAFYRVGEYGIRTENLIVCVEKEETEFGRFLEFKTLTLCPIDTGLIDVSLLVEEEKEWLNNYHKQVNEELKPLLRKDLHSFLDELTEEI